MFIEKIVLIVARDKCGTESDKLLCGCNLTVIKEALVYYLVIPRLMRCAMIFKKKWKKVAEEFLW